MLAVCLIAGFAPMSTSGCFGGFELTKKVYRFNQNVDPDKWVQEIVFLVLTIIPIYGGASLLDAIVFNSFEFWTGNNPVLASNGDRQIIETEQGVAELERIDDDTLGVAITATDGSTERLTLVREGGSFAARDSRGALLVRVASVEGQPMVIARGR
jgi:hypothetical protein